MSGSKIKSAIQNVQNIFETYMHNNDYIMVNTFNQRATISVPLTCKVGNEDFVRNEIALLTRPMGGTGQIQYLQYYDSVFMKFKLKQIHCLFVSSIQRDRAMSRYLVQQQLDYSVPRRGVPELADRSHRWRR